MDYIFKNHLNYFSTYIIFVYIPLLTSQFKFMVKVFSLIVVMRATIVMIQMIFYVKGVKDKCDTCEDYV